MAQQPAKAEAAIATPNSKKKIIIILAAVLGLVAIGGGTAFFMMNKKADAHQAKTAKAGEEAGHETEDGKADPKTTALTYVALDTFTVNLLPDPDERFLQLDLTMEVKGSELADKLKAQMPVLRNRVLLLLTSKKPTDIATPEGKAELRAELLAELQKPLTEKGKPLNITQVLFTAFVIQ